LWSRVSVSASRTTVSRWAGSAARACTVIACGSTPITRVRNVAHKADKVRWRMLALLAPSRAGVVLLIAALCGSCGSNMNILGGGGPGPGQPGHVQGFLGAVVADEPRAALAGREVLSAGGNAADAAVATGLMLSATLPSRAGLGAGGACIAYAANRKSPNAGKPEAIMFTLSTPKASPSGGDRPAAAPMLARGLYLLHARYGNRPFETLIVPAEQVARFGAPVSRALARDLAAVSGPLFNDPNARSVFSRDGVPLAEGQQLVQPDLGVTLAQIRTAGVGDLYQGSLARRIEQVSTLIGGPLALADLRGALPKLAPPIVLSDRNDQIAFLPPPADGGLAAAAAFKVLQENPKNLAGAARRALATAARWRAGGATAEAILAATQLPEVGLPELPASTSFATLDRDGNAVVCAVTLDNLFGTGRLLPGIGFFLAASPSSVPPPLLSAALAWNDNIHAFRAEAGGSGQNGAAMAVAVGLFNALRSNSPMAAPVPAPGRANVIACSRYLPSEPGTCGWAADPREAGLATGGGG
jgi:gamma-glutamyltranspeptidase/glutathione hydrolase